MKDNPIKRTLLYRAARKAALKMRTLGQGGKKETAPKELVSSYQEKLSCHSDSYRQWMREQEPALWQQWEQTLQSRKRDELPERSCLVIGYEELGGIRELSQIVEICTRNPHILLFAEKPKDLDERAVSYVENWFATEPTARLLYGAEDHRRGEERSFPWFKPCFSPDTLLGFFYLGSYFALDCTWAMQTRLAGYEDARRNLYDFVLRLLEPYYEKDRLPVYDRNYAEIACTDLVLYHRSHGADEKMPEGEGSQHVGEMSGEANPEFWGYEKQYLACKQDMISRICGAAEAYQTMYPDVWTVIPGMDKMAEDGAPLVSVVIPSKDHPELLKTCISSFVERTALPRLRERVEFIVVDNGSGEKNRKVMEDFLESAGILYQYLYRPMAFNFSAMCNMGVEQAKGTCVLLLNDDIEIIEKDWLRILLGQVQMPGTGAVGAKLWYSEGRKIQHVGVTNMSVGPSHKLSAFPDDRCYYYGHNTVSYNMIGVTAACLLIEKSVYRAMGGLDETMAVAYNDVDFCFTLTEAGFRNVIRNDAVLLHHESASREWYRNAGDKM